MQANTNIYIYILLHALERDKCMIAYIYEYMLVHIVQAYALYNILILTIKLGAS